MSDNNNLQQQLNLTLQQSQQATTPKQQNTDIKNTQTATGKRKKTSRACYQCQKTHLTCDDGNIYYSIFFF